MDYKGSRIFEFLANPIGLPIDQVTEINFQDLYNNF